MLTYTFEERGEKPYYQYLYEVLKEDIEEGRLKEGNTCRPSGLLPSSWDFSSDDHCQCL